MSGVVKQYIPRYNVAITEYLQQGFPSDIIFRQKKPGLFIITLNKEVDLKRIEGKKLLYKYGKDKKNETTIRFEKMEPFQFLQNPKWVTIDGIMDSGLRLAENSEFDQQMKTFGRLLVPTHDDTEENGVKNGRKKLRLDMYPGVTIQRWQTLQCRVKSQEVSYVDRPTLPVYAQGKVKIFYRDQPVFCKGCRIDHIGRCPVREQEEYVAKVKEEERKLEVNTLILSDSNGRYINQQATRADVETVTGAKIGHVINMLDQVDNFEHYQAVVFSAGQNNIDGSEFVNFDKWKHANTPQLQVLSKWVDGLVKAGKKTVIVEVPDVDAATATDSVTKQKNYLNKSFKTIAASANKNFFDNPHNADKDKKVERATVIKGEMEGCVGNEVKYDDWRHISKINCDSRVVQIMTALDPIPFIRAGNKLTVEKKYSAVSTSYRLGCEFCTLTGHTSTSCELKHTYDVSMEKKKAKKRKASGEQLQKDDLNNGSTTSPESPTSPLMVQQMQVAHEVVIQDQVAPPVALNQCIESLYLESWLQSAEECMPTVDPGG